MKSWKVRIGIVAVVLLVVAAGISYPLLRGRPRDIDHFFTRVFLELALERPLMLSQLRILEPYGIHFHADDLDDFSVEFERDEMREVQRNLEILRGYDFEELDPADRRSAEILEWFLAVEADGEPFLLYDYPVNQMNGVQKGLPDFLINVHQLENERDAENYAIRTAKLATALDQVIAGLDARREAGNVPPRFVLDSVRAQVQSFVASPVEEHVLVSHFESSLGEIGGLDDARRAELVDAVRGAVADVVYPAYGRLDAKLAELEQVASDAAGVWKFPDGEAYYAWLLRRHTSTELTPEQIHQLGLAEVARIQTEIRAILSEQGIETDDVGTALAALARHPRFRYPAGDGVGEEMLADYESIVDDARQRLPDLFGRLPQAQVSVERVPEFMQEGSAGAYYQPPPFDGSKPGIFYVNMLNASENPRFRMRTLAHHEALPGHHLQIALAMEMEDTPFFRRVVPFTAYSEGWALYSERLAAEQGLLPTTWDRLGMLMDELFRAARLVVDTGIHSKRWTREQAIRYMFDNTGKPASQVVTEVDRYIVMPGQATAYKVGQLQILAFRERAQEQLGDAFDLRDFHDVVLGEGAVPLAVLEAIVDEWIGSADVAAGAGS
jgi:uncharacterized protein (DUF885 family)